MVFIHQKSLIARLVLVLALLVGMFGAMPAEAVHAATLIVTNTNDGGVGSLRQAIVDADPGDTINFDPALAGQTVSLTSQISLERDLIIDGSGLMPAVGISGSLTSRIFYVGSNSSVTLQSLLLKDGRDNAGGGAIYNDGNLTVISSTFRNNSTTGNGGAIYNNLGLTVNVSKSTFVDNSAQNGGAIYLYQSPFSNGLSSNIVNNTFVGNQANSDNGNGGGIYSAINTTFGSENLFILANNTFSGNGAYAGGNLYNWGSLSFHNNIFANSTSGGDCYSMSSLSPIVVYGLNNLIEDGVPCSQGTFISGDPLLGPLADNGGPTMTMALLPGSPAIDAGTTCVFEDQRGVFRPQRNYCDIGAYEAESSIYYVKWDATGANNGSSWTNAFVDLQFALAAAASGDEIWVAAGTYKPTSGTDRAATFQLKQGVSIYGGFAGIETTRSQRDPVANVTVLSGDIDNNDTQTPIITDLASVTGNATNSYHVVTGADHATLDGFTITAGNASGIWGSNTGNGGGLYNNSSSPILIDLIFSGNLASAGGGMGNSASSPILSDITFSGNRATAFGGGMFNYSSSSPSVTDVTFVNNLAQNGGGMHNHYSNPTLMSVTFHKNGLTYVGGGGAGMENYYSSPRLTNVLFSENAPAYLGGGMSNYNSNPILTNVTFDKNSATNGGGGINNYYNSSPTLIDVTFKGNTAPGGGGMRNYSYSSPSLTRVAFIGNSGTYGGGVDNILNSNPTLTNVTFSNNSAAYGGGMQNIDNSSPTLTNVTFTGNSATSAGGGIYIVNNAPNSVIRNSVLWGNTGNQITNTSTTLTVSDSVVQGGCPALSTCTNIITADPILGALGDYGGSTRTIPLLAGSSAIDAGNDSYCPATDQRNVVRPQGNHCDIGAFEYAEGPVGTATPTQSPTPTFTPTSTPKIITISGNAGVAGATLSYFDGVQKTVTSDNSGNYSISIAATYWGGTVTPSKVGYRFWPISQSYSIYDSVSGSDYVAERVYTISGNTGVPGVTLSYFDSTPKSVSADSAGNYSLQVPENWTGTITPSRLNYDFSPASRSYSNVQSDQSSQNYVATPLYTISGNAGIAGAVLSYSVDGQLRSVTSSSTGNYSFTVKAGWSGTVTPTKVGATFTPASKTYVDIQSNQTGSDYVATITVNTVVDGGAGSLRQAINDAVSGATIRFDPALAGQTIHLIATLVANKDLKIDGSGLNPRVEINGGGAVRLFELGRSGGNSTLQSLILKNGNVTGTGSSNGAAILVKGGVITIRDVSFVGNAAYDGGAIYSNLYGVDLRISQSEFLTNSAQHYGGAIYVQYGKLTLQHSNVNSNTADAIGGGVLTYQGGPFLFEENNFVGNSAANNGGALALMSRQDSVVVRSNLFSSNHATLYYGGALVDSLPYTSVVLTIENNTFYNNSANNAGAMIVSNTVLLKNNTFSDNKATQAPGESTAGSLYLSRPLNATVSNNIVANSSGGSACILYGSGVTTINGSNNLVEDGSGPCFTLPGAITADPMLGPLADNGGSTKTMALLAGSPAIDAGTAADCSLTDQRGLSRPQGSGCDMGAYEYVAPATPTPTNTPTNTPTPTSTPPYSYQPLYVSLTGSQTIGGVASADEDILKFDGQNWSLFFDGSDVGMGSPDLFAFSIVDENTLLMSFGSNVKLGGVTVTPQDVLRFDATSLGTTTAGTFSLYFDGSDVGFDASAENIDSLTLLPDGRLLISTTGNPSVPGLSGLADEDILAFTPTLLGNTTSGTWALHFDGSDVGLSTTSGEDIDALDVVGETIYLSTLDNFSVAGVAGADEDIFVCTSTSLGSNTACTFSPLLYFDGSTWGLSGNDVDAFNFLASGPLPTAAPTNTPTGTPTHTPTRTPSPTSTPTATQTTAPPTSMFAQIVQPNGGEVLTVGNTYRIRWNSTADIDKVSLGYKSCDSCLDWIATNIPNVGYYDWTVYVGNTINTQFKIEIIAYDTGVGSVVDLSDNNFTVLQPTPTATSTPTATWTPSATFTPLPSFTPSPTSAGSDLIFADGFESGSLSAWTASVTNGGNLSGSQSAALAGSHGLQATITNTSAMYVRDDSPKAEMRYRARFAFDPNSISVPSGEYVALLQGSDISNTNILVLRLYGSSSGYQLRVRAYDSGLANWVSTPLVNITDAAHVLEIVWGNDGHISFWVDGVQQANLTGVNNSSYRMDSIRLGATYISGGGISGSFYIDAFESRR